jgi:TrkA domain protein
MEPRQPDRRVLNAEVTEQSLRGIGKRYELAHVEGGNVVVIIHHSGRTDLYVMDERAGEPRAAVALSDAQARTLGAVLGGAYFKPAVVEAVDAVIGGLLIDWFTLREDSPGVGKTISELEIRRRTRMTVAAIARDKGSIVAPEPAEQLLAGDRLVVIGRPEDVPTFVAHVVG